MKAAVSAAARRCACFKRFHSVVVTSHIQSWSYWKLNLLASIQSSMFIHYPLYDVQKCYSIRYLVNIGERKWERKREKEIDR